MDYLSLDQILSAEDLPTKDIEIPEWGGVVKIQGLSKAKADKVSLECFDDDGEVDTAKLQVQMVLHCLVEPKITEAELTLLVEKKASVFNRLAVECMAHNGSTEEVAEQSAATFPEGAELQHEQPED